MAGGKPNLGRGVEQQLQFIEFRLFWEGHVNRSDLIEQFGVSPNQTSGDLNRYIALVPDNMVYGKGGKAYVRSSGFIPLFRKPDATSCLSQMHSVADGVVASHDSWICSLPAFDAPSAPTRGVDPRILCTIVIAARGKEAVEILYQSMSAPEPQWWRVAPYALTFDGFRLHARYFCEKSCEFRDFVVSRVIETRHTRPASSSPVSDLVWHGMVTLEIGPHPGLSTNQKHVIWLDYGMHEGQVTITVRCALLYYALRWLGVDTDPTVRAPQDQQIILLNGESVRELGA